MGVACAASKPHSIGVSERFCEESGPAARSDDRAIAGPVCRDTRAIPYDAA
jgi:hypothetical protein